MSSSLRELRRAELLLLRLNDPNQLIAIYHKAAGNDVFNSPTPVVRLEEMITAILDHEESQGRFTSPSERNESTELR